MSSTSTAAYYDFQGLSALRTQAANAPTEAIGEVAEQFEALFVQMMVKSMRDATIEGGLFDSDQMEVYQSMFDQQISLQLSSDGVLGLSDILVEQLDGTGEGREKSTSGQNLSPVVSLLAEARRHINIVTPTASGVSHIQSAGEKRASTTGETGRGDVDWSPSSPEEFIRDVWDFAVDAAKQLDLDPLVLVAQSALETAWGKKVIRSADGGSSYNLFGVKAGSSWDAQSTSVSSLEFREGVAAMEKSSFRVYDSIASSFDDYVRFLKTNPRYQFALDKVADSREFLTGLQDAGYATDPGYAEKIMGIIGTTAFESVVSELKNF